MDLPLQLLQTFNTGLIPKLRVITAAKTFRLQPPHQLTAKLIKMILINQTKKTIKLQGQVNNNDGTLSSSPEHLANQQIIYNIRKTGVSSGNQTTNNSQIISPHFKNNTSIVLGDLQNLKKNQGTQDNISELDSQNRKVNFKHANVGTDMFERNQDLKGAMSSNISEVIEQTFEPKSFTFTPQQTQSKREAPDKYSQSRYKNNINQNQNLNDWNQKGEVRINESKQKRESKENLNMQSSSRAEDFGVVGINYIQNQDSKGSLRTGVQNKYLASRHTFSKNNQNSNELYEISNSFRKQIQSPKIMNFTQIQSNGILQNYQTNQNEQELNRHLEILGKAAMTLKSRRSFNASKESRMTSKSQTHSQIMQMMKQYEEYGQNLQTQNIKKFQQIQLSNWADSKQPSQRAIFTNQNGIANYIIATSRSDETFNLVQFLLSPQQKSSKNNLQQRLESKININENQNYLDFCEVMHDELNISDPEKRSIQIIDKLFNILYKLSMQKKDAQNRASLVTKVIKNGKFQSKLSKQPQNQSNILKDQTQNFIDSLRNIIQDSKHFDKLLLHLQEGNKKQDINISQILESITNKLKNIQDSFDIYNIIIQELFSLDQKNQKEFKVFIQTGGKYISRQKINEDLNISKKFKVMKGKLYESVPLKQHRFVKEIHQPKYSKYQRQSSRNLFENSIQIQSRDSQFLQDEQDSKKHDDGELKKQSLEEYKINNICQIKSIGINNSPFFTYDNIAEEDSMIQNSGQEKDIINKVETNIRLDENEVIKTIKDTNLSKQIKTNSVLESRFTSKTQTVESFSGGYYKTIDKDLYNLKLDKNNFQVQKLLENNAQQLSDQIASIKDTIRQINQSPLKSPKLFLNQEKNQIEQRTIQDQDQLKITQKLAKRPMTCKTRVLTQTNKENAKDLNTFDKTESHVFWRENVSKQIQQDQRNKNKPSLQFKTHGKQSTDIESAFTTKVAKYQFIQTQNMKINNEFVQKNTQHQILKRNNFLTNDICLTNKQKSKMKKDVQLLNAISMLQNNNQQQNNNKNQNLINQINPADFALKLEVKGRQKSQTLRRNIKKQNQQQNEKRDLFYQNHQQRSGSQQRVDTQIQNKNYESPDGRSSSKNQTQSVRRLITLRSQKSSIQEAHQTNQRKFNMKTQANFSINVMGTNFNTQYQDDSLKKTKQADDLLDDLIQGINQSVAQNNHLGSQELVSIEGAQYDGNLQKSINVTFIRNSDPALQDDKLKSSGALDSRGSQRKLISLNKAEKFNSKDDIEDQDIDEEDFDRGPSNINFTVKKIESVDQKYQELPQSQKPYMHYKMNEKKYKIRQDNLNQLIFKYSPEKIKNKLVIEINSGDFDIQQSNKNSEVDINMMPETPQNDFKAKKEQNIFFNRVRAQTNSDILFRNQLRNLNNQQNFKIPIKISNEENPKFYLSNKSGMNFKGVISNQKLKKNYEENKPIYEVQTEELNHSKSGPLDIAGSFCQQRISSMSKHISLSKFSKGKLETDEGQQMEGIENIKNVVLYSKSHIQEAFNDLQFNLQNQHLEQTNNEYQNQEVLVNEICLQPNSQPANVDNDINDKIKKKNTNPLFEILQLPTSTQNTQIINNKRQLFTQNMNQKKMKILNSKTAPLSISDRIEQNLKKRDQDIVRFSKCSQAGKILKDYKINQRTTKRNMQEKINTAKVLIKDHKEQLRDIKQIKQQNLEIVKDTKEQIINQKQFITQNIQQDYLSFNLTNQKHQSFEQFQNTIQNYLKLQDTQALQNIFQNNQIYMFNQLNNDGFLIENAQFQIYQNQQLQNILNMNINNEKLNQILEQNQNDKNIIISQNQMEYQNGADCQTAELSENYQMTNLSNIVGAEALQHSFQHINQSILVKNTNTIIYDQNQNENKTKTIDISQEIQKKDFQMNDTQKESLMKYIAQQKIFKDSSVYKTIKDEENNTSGFNQNLDFNLSQSGFEFPDQQTQFRLKGSYAVESFFDSQNDQQTQFQNHQVIQNLKKFKQNLEKPQDYQDKFITMNQKNELEKLILDHIKHSIVSKQNIKNILDSKNQLKLIKAADADYMNQTVFNKYARSFAQREGIQTDADVVLRDCKDKINDLYQNVADYFANNQVQNFQQFDFSQERQKFIDIKNNNQMFYQNNSGLSIQEMKDNNFYKNQNVIIQNSSSISAQAADKDQKLINQKQKNNIKFLYENTQLLHFQDLKRNSTKGQNSVGMNQKSPNFERKFDLNIQIKHKNSKRMSQMKSRRGSSDNQRQKNNEEQFSRIVLQKKGTQQITRNIMPLKLRAPVYTGLSNLQKRPSSQVANTSQMDKKHSQIDDKSSITYLGSSQRKTNEKKTNSEIGMKADKKLSDNDLGVDGKTIQQLSKIPVNDKTQLQQTTQLKQNQKNYGLLKIGPLNNQSKRNQDYAFTNSSQRNNNQIIGVEGIIFQNNNKILRIESNNNLQNEYANMNQSQKGKGLKMMPSSIQSFQTENLN